MTEEAGGQPSAAQRARSWLTRTWAAHARDILAALAVALIVIVGGFSEVAFGGKTFSTNGFVPSIDACHTTETPCPLTAKAKNDPRQDPFPQAWQLNPWSHVTSESLHDGRLPLWNPYEGSGAPLAANMSSGVFDPLLLVVNLHPTILTWDITFLVILALNGVMTFVLARVVGLRRQAAMASGVIFALCGFFYLTGNNSFFRVQLYAPLTLLAVEWVMRRRGALPVLGYAAAVAGCLLVGMPEPGFIIISASVLYAIVRLFTGPRVDSRPMTLARFAGAGGLALTLAAPLLLPFSEYLGQAKTFKSDSGLLVDPKQNILNWIAPKIQAPSAWTGTRNWVGAAAVVAAIVGVASPARMRRHCGWAFVAVGTAIALKIYGVVIFREIGHLPGASQTLWPTFGTPSVALPVAILAGIGIESVFSEGPNRRWLALIGGGGLLTTGVLVLVHRSKLELGFDTVARAGGWGLAVLAALVVIGAVLVRRPKISGAIVVAMILVEVVLLVPRGFYSDREDPFPRTAWTDKLVALVKSPAHSRIMSTDGMLFTDTAGVYGLADARVIDAVYVERYFRYIKTFVSKGILDRWMAVGPTESAPTISNNPMFDLMGARYLIQKHAIKKPIAGYRLVARVGGRYIYENLDAYPRAFLVHDTKVVQSENEAVAVLKRGGTPNPDGSTRPALDPRAVAVVEATKRTNLGSSKCSGAPPDAVTITHYDASRIEMHVDAACRGLVVLSDTYFPGWEATVNGTSRDILATDLAYRGIPVAAGRSTIVLHYRPASFRHGVEVAILGLGTFVLVVIFFEVRRRRAASRGVPAST